MPHRPLESIALPFPQNVGAIRGEVRSALRLRRSRPQRRRPRLFPQSSQGGQRPRSSACSRRRLRCVRSEQPRADDTQWPLLRDPLLSPRSSVGWKVFRPGRLRVCISSGNRPVLILKRNDDGEAQRGQGHKFWTFWVGLRSRPAERRRQQREPHARFADKSGVPPTPRPCLTQHLMRRR